MRPEYPDFHGTSVLFVDDDVEVRKLVAAILNRVGARTVCVESGLAALQELDRLTPDVVLLDLLMPGMDGFALRDEIRARGFVMPVIALSGRTLLNADMERESTASFDAFIRKPFEPSQLAWLIYDTLGKAR